jgi:hypothetical protein
MYKYKVVQIFSGSCKNEFFLKYYTVIDKDKVSKVKVIILPIFW